MFYDMFHDIIKIEPSQWTKASLTARLNQIQSRNDTTSGLEIISTSEYSRILELINDSSLAD